MKNRTKLKKTKQINPNTNQTYSISSQLLKHLDQYLIELERSFDGIAFRSTMLTTGMQSIHSEYMLDQFWCTKRHFNPLREAHVEIINLQIDYGQMHLISGPNSTYRFVSIMDDWSVVFRLMADQVQPISIRSNYRWLPKGEIQIESFELLQNEPKTEIKVISFFFCHQDFK